MRFSEAQIQLIISASLRTLAFVAFIGLKLFQPPEFSEKFMKSAHNPGIGEEDEDSEGRDGVDYMAAMMRSTGICDKPSNNGGTSKSDDDDTSESEVDEQTEKPKGNVKSPDSYGSRNELINFRKKNFLKSPYNHSRFIFKPINS